MRGDKTDILSAGQQIIIKLLKKIIYKNHNVHKILVSVLIFAG